MKRSCLLKLASLLPFCFTSTAVATVTFDWVTVGDPGNPADTRIMDKGGRPDDTTGYGSVGYTYRIAEHHVTNSQYAEFLNAVDPSGEAADPFWNESGGIYNFNMTSSTIGGQTGTAYTGGIAFTDAAPAGSKYSTKSGQANYPATWVNWNSGARFVNWMHNGQGTGDTDNGVYDLTLYDATGELPPRQADATVFLPSEDEFYKAAYYDPTKNGTGGYWAYGVQSDAVPVAEAPPGGSTSANARLEDKTYWQTETLFDDSVDHLTEVGAYSSATSHYGLADTEGLLYQWTEGSRLAYEKNFPVYRGGAWYYGSDSSGAGHRNLYSFPHAASYHWFGLRIASPAPPGLAGDYNDDGAVDAADYTTWRDNLGAADETSLSGNGDGMNGVDVGDYTRWKNNFGSTTGASLPPATNTDAVPEPATLWLLILTAALGLCQRPRGYRLGSIIS
jgi:formylglycine-generating enzyme required for sulfatase activity